MPAPKLVRDGEGDPSVLDERNVRAVLGDTTPVEATCHCHRVYQPIHFVNSTMDLVREALELLEKQTGRKVAPDAVAGSYRCGRCKGVAQVTARALGLVQVS